MSWLFGMVGFLIAEYIGNGFADPKSSILGAIGVGGIVQALQAERSTQNAEEKAEEVAKKIVEDKADY